MNVVALVGRLSRPPEERILDSGTRLMSLQVSVPGADGRAETVPVAWFDPAASALDLDEGDPVVVVGRVRRRFFRTGAGTQSRTEVVAERVAAARRPAAVRSALGAAVEALAAGIDRPADATATASAPAGRPASTAPADRSARAADKGKAPRPARPAPSR